MKIITKIILIASIIIGSFTIIQMVSISNKYVNRSIITFDVNNPRSKPVKKVVRYLDLLYSKILIRFSSKHKDYYKQDFNEYSNLPAEKIIKKKENNFSENLYPLGNIKEWVRSHGNSSAIRFSSLKKINKSNLDQLNVAWTFNVNDEIGSDIQANPIVANGKIYFPSMGTKILAIDAKNGKLIWEFDSKMKSPARRGMVYHVNESREPLLFFTAYNKIYSLNANTGIQVSNFGKNGFVKLRYTSSTSPAIYKNQIIITTSEPAVEIYTLSGKLIWKYYLRKVDKKNKRIGGKRFDYSGGNPWGGFSLDKKRGIAFISTGNAGSYFNGISRPGDNKNANSIIAIDINNKKKLWDFQEVRHDIWNLDIPSTPILGVIERNKKKIDVVIGLTKLGNTLVLDRITGEPIYDFILKKAPLSKIPGEKTSFYQPAIKLPEPFAKQTFRADDVSNISKDTRLYIKDLIIDHKYGFFKPYELNKKNIQFNFHGGAEWAGGSFNVKDGTLYVSSSNIAWETELKKIEGKTGYYEYSSNFKRLKDKNGYPGNKPPWGTLTSLNLNTGLINWQVPLGEYKELKNRGVPQTGTENYSGVTATESGIIISSGALDKKITIFDSLNGKKLWSHDLPFIGSCPPTTYKIEEEQYILVCATGGYSLKDGYPNLVEFGNKMIAYKLKN
jgi:glucose dehydrogenase